MIRTDKTGRDKLDPQICSVPVHEGTIGDVCNATLDKYGVGSCGPRGFYGTMDVHLQLEVTTGAG